MAERLHLSPGDIAALTVDEFDSAVAYLKGDANALDSNGQNPLIAQAQKYGGS